LIIRDIIFDGVVVYIDKALLVLLLLLLAQAW